MSEIINFLVDGGMSKYAIAKKCGVRWNTVNMWYRGVFKPTVEHENMLSQLFNELQEKKEKK